MPAVRLRLPLALALSLGAHAGVLAALWALQGPPALVTVPLPLQANLVIPPIEEIKPAPVEPPRPRPAEPAPQPEQEKPPRVEDSPPEKAPATMAAPPAPSAAEWQAASTYTLKNSKRYRYTWAQQVRSMMGTAIEGVRQGLVRVRVEIAPDGRLARVDVLWSTSEVVEKLALEAIRALPPTPPTPTGKPLVFEKTIALLPFETGWPPIYKYDCLPDPPAFRNRFAWDGSSPRPPAPDAAEQTPPSASTAAPTECPDAGPDSIEAEEKDMERQFKEWGSRGLNRGD
jgi:TonB family protein